MSLRVVFDCTENAVATVLGNATGGQLRPVRQTSHASESSVETTTSGVESGGGLPDLLDGDAVDGELPLEVGMMVEVVDTPPIFGVLRWIGNLPGKSQTAAGIELDDEFSLGTDGTYGTQRLFQCAARRAMFVFLDRVRRDTRFVENERFAQRKPCQGETIGWLPTFVILVLLLRSVQHSARCTAPMCLVTLSRPWRRRLSGSSTGDVPGRFRRQQIVASARRLGWRRQRAASSVAYRATTTRAILTPRCSPCLQHLRPSMACSFGPRSRRRRARLLGGAACSERRHRESLCASETDLLAFVQLEGAGL